ncbi:hypothetical protein [Nocardia nova]|nr:hypothetical protein [Nocardia nova]
MARHPQRHNEIGDAVERADLDDVRDLLGPAPGELDELAEHPDHDDGSR